MQLHKKKKSKCKHNANELKNAFVFKYVSHGNGNIIIIPHLTTRKYKKTCNIQGASEAFGYNEMPVN